MPAPQRIFIMGPSCSGKGTLAHKLSAALNLPIFSTGDALRAMFAAGGPLAEALRPTMEHGALAPTPLVVDITKKALEAPTYARGAIFDGGGRKIEEAQALQAAGIGPTILINMHADADLLVQRALGRWIHPASGRTYHEVFTPPRVPGKDDVTGEDLVRRGDDTADGIRARLAWYESETTPAIAWMKEHCAPHYLDVDASAPSSDTFTRVSNFCAPYV